MDLEDVFRTYQRDVYAYFLGLARNRQDAEDLAQETFSRAWAGAVRFKGRSSMRTWLFGIAHNVWSEAVRKRARGKKLAAAVSLASNPSDDTASVDVLEALAHLEPSDREVIALVDLLGFPAPEAAELIAISPEALRVRLHRARLKMRRAYVRE